MGGWGGGRVEILFLALLLIKYKVTLLYASVSHLQNGTGDLFYLRGIMAMKQNAILLKNILKNPVMQASNATSNSAETQGRYVHVSTKHMYKNVHSSSICNSPRVEAS